MLKQIMTTSAFVLGFAATAMAANFDIVINNGHVIDPESGFNAVRHVGISGDRISFVSETPLEGEVIIDATGKLVTPGFIDLHTHSPSELGQHYQLMDGVTTALELEAGAFPSNEYGSAISEKPLINFGASSGYVPLRLQTKNGVKVVDGVAAPTPTGFKGVISLIHTVLTNLNEGMSETFTEEASGEEIEEMNARLAADIDAGSLGIGLALDYVNEAVNEAEVEAIFRTAASKGVPIYVHVRRGIDGDPAGLREAIMLAEKTGASVHICHVTHNAISNLDLFLKEIRDARKRGVDITTEVLPYNAGSAAIGSAVFGRDWQTIFGITYKDVQRADTGERFTKDTFEDYRENHASGGVIHHYLKEEWTRHAVTQDDIIIVSDLLPMQTKDKKVAPHNGAFTKILHRYVRDEQILDLPTAIRKMTLMPAQRLEEFAPAFKRKGRIKAGADADILVIDLEGVISHPSYENPYREPEGIEHIIVNGVHLVEDGKLKPDTYPGRRITSKTN